MNSSIDQYERGGERLRSAIAGLSREEMIWRPPADAGVGLWSVQQIVIHVMDSDLVGIDRMKRTIAENNPLLIGYNETLFSQSLYYDDQSADDAINILELTRRQFAKVLRKLPKETYERTAVHSERGMVTLGQELHGYNWHLDHHLDFINKKRAKLGNTKA